MMNALTFGARPFAANMLVVPFSLLASSYWINLVTPDSGEHRLSRSVVEGLTK